jgi:hypothetical protein
MADFKITIPILGKIIAYIYDFCTYKKHFNLRVLFGSPTLDNESFRLEMTLINKTTYNIEIHNIYVKNKNSELKIRSYEQNQDGIMGYVFYPELKKSINLLPCDTEKTYIFQSKLRNESDEVIQYTGKQDYLFIDFKIKNIKKSLFFSNLRTIKVVIPI